MVQVTSALLAIAAAAAGLAGATETPAPTLTRTLAYFKPAAADEAAAPPPALSKLTQAVTPAPKEVPASKEEPSAAEAYLERAKAFAVEHGKVLGGTLLALVAAVLALGGKKKAETNGSRVAAPVAPVEVTRDLCGNQISGAPRHRRDGVSVAASARWRGVFRLT